MTDAQLGLYADEGILADEGLNPDRVIPIGAKLGWTTLLVDVREGRPAAVPEFAAIFPEYS